ncbi:MAG: HalD/BesD family halogenase [Chloroflexota bacterium]
MTMTVRQKLEHQPISDSAVTEHHYTPYLRDYDVFVEVPAALPNGKGSYIESRYRYRFTHCVTAEVTTAVSADIWRKSWDNVLIDYETWQNAGEPNGYVWGVGYSDAYPGLRYIEGSKVAQDWSRRLEKEMHEIMIETNGHNIRLVFHDVEIQKVAQGDPETRELKPLVDENNMGRS